MPDQNQLLPGKDAPFLPKSSIIVLVVHLGVSLFFLVAYFLFYANIETIKMMIQGYYTLFSVFFLFFYDSQLRIKHVYLIWVIIAVVQLFFYLINIHNHNWAKWSFPNVLSTLVGLPVVLALFKFFSRMSEQREGKELVIGIRALYKPTRWDMAATIIIPLVALIVCLF